MMRIFRSTVVVIGGDEIVRTGNTVKLTAIAKKRFCGLLTTDVVQTKVTFVANKQFVMGSGVTNNKGVVEVDYRTTAPGIYHIRYQIDNQPVRCWKGRLFVTSGQHPALVVDIDGTISDYPDWKVPFGGAEAPTFPHAASLLGKLAQLYDIVYITARDDALRRLTMAFLRNHNFPAGPIFYNRWEKQPFPKQRMGFKYKIIEKLQRAGVNVVAGIGDTPTDARAYLNAGLDAYIRKGKHSVADKAVTFENYTQLDALLSAKESYYQDCVRKARSNKAHGS